MQALKLQVHTTRETMLDASFTKTIREAMDNFFLELKGRLVSSDAQIDEIKKMMDVMYDKFSKEQMLFMSRAKAAGSLCIVAHQVDWKIKLDYWTEEMK
jgi:hypothetical protein